MVTGRVGMPEGRSRLASHIARARREVGLSQVELAGKLGVAQSLVGRWETSREPSLEMVNAIEVACGLTKGELLRRAGFVGESPSVLLAIEADRKLTPAARRMLLASYRSAVKERRK